MNGYSKTLHNAPTSNFRKGRERSTVIAFCLGAVIIAASIFLGRSFVFAVSFLALSIFMTMLWKRSPRPWISLVSISAAIPITISKQNFNGNLIFALWYAIFNLRNLFKLPKWIYLSSFLVILGLITSSLNWMTIDPLRNLMRQSAFAYNFFLGPFLLLPLLYLKMRESRDHVANLQGLLFFLIVPSTVLLISAKMFGTVANAWQASQHAAMLPEGFLQYQLGKVIINFLRTEVGFILAALICASAAISVSQVKSLYRFLAGACLALNVFLLLATGSFGSAFACTCGLLAIFFTLFRKVSVTKALVSVVVICCTLILSYSFAPQSTKDYLEKRYKHRVVKADTDRVVLWGRAVEHFLQHPEGVGLTLSVGDRVKSFIHNDYLTYAVSYGFFGGVAYVSLVVGLLISFLRVRKSAINDPAALAVYLAGLGVIVALAVNSMTDHSNENRWYFNVIWSMIWYSYFCSRPLQNQNRSVGNRLEEGN